MSIVICAYNAARVIGRAIQSLTKQTFTDWECIICDDASSDNTWTAIQDLTKGFNNFKVIKNETNLGPASSRNRCVEIAKGEFLAIQDADDWSSPERLERQVEYLDRHLEVNAVGSYAALLGNDETQWGVMKPPLLPRKEDWVRGPQIIHASVLFRTVDFVALGGYTGGMRFAEDYDLWVRFVTNGKKISTIPEVLYSIRSDVNDYTRKGLSQRWSEMAVVLRAFRSLHCSVWQLVYLGKPFIAGILPARLLHSFHRYRFDR
ncbi:MAG TPA: glycosyltransferase family A protein [Syntrophorhabdaceae bacterium]|nr:glycosyltransferase family A protein [Syntrophorhabdaceae bacterium]